MTDSTILKAQQPGVNASNLAAYRAVRDGGAGVLDLTSRGRMRVSGSEAVMFLNGLITNDMKTLAAHRWMPAAFPNVQGRLIAAVRVIRLLDDTSPVFLIDTEAATHKTVLQTIERFTMAGDFLVTDITAATSMLSVQGPEASRVIQQVLSESVEELPHDGVTQLKWETVDTIVVRASHTAEDGFDVIVDTTKSAELLKAFIAAGATRIGEELKETLRIEAGIGRFGQDMDETNVISEANLDDAVSFTKGCYIGQEIIARIKYRGHVAKKLAGLIFENTHSVEVGATIRSAEGKEIGRITSVTFSPKLARTVALGYLRYEHLASGTDVTVGADGFKATVTELPIVPGSFGEVNSK